MSLKTPLYDQHLQAGGKLVEFAGYSLPINYGSQIEEHHAVRVSAGMFDVSHMTIIDLVGKETEAWLRYLLTNDVGKLANGRALYSCMCNESGGVIDDLIAYRLDQHRYRLIVNAATREKDIAWLMQHKPSSVKITLPEQQALIAIQGPQALQCCESAIKELSGNVVDLNAIPRFSCIEHKDWFIARTGYTGEDGVEVALPASDAADFWTSLGNHGVRPIGLGARDTLRLEAGMSLYGNDLDEDHTPIESGIAWTVDLTDSNRDFIAKDLLKSQKQEGARYHLLGLILDGRGVLRNGQAVMKDGVMVGVVTSGSFSPTRQQSIALARVDSLFSGECHVVIRNNEQPAHSCSIPFVKNGVAS
ncbi:MAG: glycine cleavage system aminomethyltransferase GcvT [Granulosicoccus sp.]